MSIPKSTIDGILPPFTGLGPGDDPALMSPYEADSIDVVARFGRSEGRKQILNGWLDHRSELRRIGLVRGFQWLDGSFLEEKEPRDLDVVSFFHLPDTATREEDQIVLWNANAHVFERSAVKLRYFLDAFFLSLESTPESLVSLSRYFLQLFSHQRESYLWKGMIQVPLEEARDDEARGLLQATLPSTVSEESRP